MNDRVARAAERQAAIVAVWNRGDQSLAQIGQSFGMPRNSVGRVLTDARHAGLEVLRIDPVETGRRTLAARLANRDQQST